MISKPIISASYKTDIPAFYAKWFINRIREGYCFVRNPFNNKYSELSLSPSNVAGIVFWTKNVGPLLHYLPELKKRGYPFAVQFAINNYPRSLERSVVSSSKAIQYADKIASQFGPDVVVWRYDPILLTNETNYGWHIANFTQLASKLAGATNEVIVSFTQIYRKTKRNIEIAANKFGFEWWDPDNSEKIELLLKLAQIANNIGIRLSICGQRELLASGIHDASCIDPVRLSRIADKEVITPIKSHRKECGCYASKDIGEYDTCVHGCVFCYSVSNHQSAKVNRLKHDPHSPYFLLPKNDSNAAADTERQLDLF